MKTFSANYITEIEAESFTHCHLLKMEFGTTIYFTDFDLDVLFDSNLYLGRGIEFENVNSSISQEIDNISFSIDNVDQIFSAFVGTEELRGKVITIYNAVLDTSHQLIDSEISFLGIIDSIEVDQQIARFNLLNYFYKWNTITLRKHPPTCAWLFKDTDTCAYVEGETWCDKSFDRCVSLDNEEHYGGFPFLPEIQDKQIWWGRENK